MNNIKGPEGERWIRCQHHDDPPWARQCIKRAELGGAVYCEEHYFLYHTDTGIDSGPGLGTVNFVNILAREKLNYGNN